MRQMFIEKNNELYAISSIKKLGEKYKNIKIYK